MASSLNSLCGSYHGAGASQHYHCRALRHTRERLSKHPAVNAFRLSAFSSTPACPSILLRTLPAQLQARPHPHRQGAQSPAAPHHCACAPRAPQRGREVGAPLPPFSLPPLDWPPGCASALPIGLPVSLVRADWPPRSPQALRRRWRPRPPSAARARGRSAATAASCARARPTARLPPPPPRPRAPGR